MLGIGSEKQIPLHLLSLMNFAPGVNERRALAVVLHIGHAAVGAAARGDLRAIDQKARDRLPAAATAARLTIIVLDDGGHKALELRHLIRGVVLKLQLCLVAQSEAQLGIGSHLFLRLLHAGKVEAVARDSILVDGLVG